MTQYLKDELPTFESGTVLLSTGDIQVMRVNLTSKVINVDIEDKDFIKRIIGMRGELTPKLPSPGTAEKPKPTSTLTMLKTVAETLKKSDITLTVSYRGHSIATIGANAKPKLLQLITKTRAVAINSLWTAIRMIV
jgi:tartrate dehydratase beta subunit/fumarate hydratase class I family protein